MEKMQSNINSSVVVADRYEVVQQQFVFLIKDHNIKQWIATCKIKRDADNIVFILNEFEKSKY